MPLVFGGAPLVNVLVSMAMHPPKTPPNPLLYVGVRRWLSLAPAWCCVIGRDTLVP